MRIIRYLGLSITLIFFVGCFPTTEGYEQILRTWVGQTEQHLVDKWGIPDSTYSVGEYKYLTYNYRKSGYVLGTAPSSYTTNFIGNTAYTTSYGGTSGYSYTNTCKTTFKLANKRILSWSWEGNSCKAVEE